MRIKVRFRSKNGKAKTEFRVKNEIFGPYKGDMKRLATRPATKKLYINPETMIEVQFGVGQAGFYLKVNRKYFEHMLSSPVQAKPSELTRGEVYNDF